MVLSYFVVTYLNITKRNKLSSMGSVKMKYIFFFSVHFQKRNNFGVMFIKTTNVKCKFNVTILIPNILDLTLRIFILKKRM